jgi:hypothetical protein
LQYENKRNIKRKGLTLSQLADTMDVSRQALSRQVAGKLLVEKAEEIATALNVPIWQLFVSPNEVAGGGDELTASIRYQGEFFNTTSKEELKQYVNDL